MFLHYSGYHRVSEPRQRYDGLFTANYCVGVDTQKGEYGEVVWFHREICEDTTRVIISTYRDQHFVCEVVNAADYVWYRIN